MNKEEILDRKRKYGIANERFIELFMCDFKILKVINDISPDFILKGGAAAQLYLPIEKQRASIDLDLMTHLKREDVEKIFSKIEYIKRYTPKKAVVNLAMVTYLARIESVIDKSEIEVKIDAFFDEHPKISPKLIRDKKLFALDIDFPIRVVSEGYLAGDKILTLATESVGVTGHRISELPKHVYDIARLTETIYDKVLDDFIHSFRYNLEREIKRVDLELKEVDILDNILSTLDRFCTIDTACGRGDVDIKRHILNFQSQYLTNQSRIGLSSWISDALRVKYLITLIKKHSLGTIATDYVLEKYRALLFELEKIRSMNRDEREKMSSVLYSKIKAPYKKQLRGKMLERIYLEVVNQDESF